jgi:hypothetical protein
MVDVSNATGSLRQANPVKTVTGQRIAKATHGYPPLDKGQGRRPLAPGELHIRPTAKSACRVFGVSYRRLKLAQAYLAERPVNGNGATVLSDEVVERIVAEIGIDRIFRAADQLTAPELPLQAAE